MQTVFRTKIRDGRITLGSEHNEARFREWAKKHEGAELRLIHEKPTRSRSQNALYWAYLTIIADETGDNANDLHEYFKRKLLPPRFVGVRNEMLKLPASTASLNKNDFTEYLMRISALTNIPIPNPEDAGYITG